MNSKPLSPPNLWQKTSHPEALANTSKAKSWNGIGQYPCLSTPATFKSCIVFAWNSDHSKKYETCKLASGEWQKKSPIRLSQWIENAKNSATSGCVSKSFLGTNWWDMWNISCFHFLQLLWNFLHPRPWQRTTRIVEDSVGLVSSGKSLAWAWRPWITVFFTGSVEIENQESLQQDINKKCTYIAIASMQHDHC